MEFIQYLIDFIIHIDVHLKELTSEYGTWIYAILFLIIFCETGLIVTPFLPGDSLLFVAGTLAARQDNDMNIILLTVLLCIAAILGDSVNYSIGKGFGKRLFKNTESKIFKQSYLIKTQEFYKKHGGKTVIIARFVPIIRTFAPFVAGMGRMNYKYFINYNILGGFLWVSIFTVCGYFVGNIPWVQNNLKILIVVIIVVSLLPGIIEIIRNKLKK